jgi:hypothetical protein
MLQKFLKKEETGLWLVDTQEVLFPHIDRCCEILEKICFIIQAAQILKLPLFVTEQYPVGLGETVAQIKKHFPEGQVVFPKTTFSGYKEPKIQKAVDHTGVNTWILIGIEAHICVLQTAKDLLAAKKEVVILNDAVSSRSLFDFSTAIAELRDHGARISCSEAIVYEMVRDAHTPEFQMLLPLVKAHAQR